VDLFFCIQLPFILFVVGECLTFVVRSHGICLHGVLDKVESQSVSE